MRKIYVGLLLTLILVVSVVVMFEVAPPPYSILSVSQININSALGSQVGNSITGTYWNILLTADNIGGLNFYTFNNASLGASGSQAWTNPQTEKTEQVTVKNVINVEIDAGQPYIQRPMQLESVEVVPKAFQNYQPLFPAVNGPGKDQGTFANPLYSGSWHSTTSDWVLYTPLKITVSVNGKQFSSTYITNVPGTVTSTVVAKNPLTATNGSANDYVTATLLGQLSTGYNMPIWSGVVWFNNQYFFLDSPTLEQGITGVQNTNPALSGIGYPQGNGLNPDTTTYMAGGTYATNSYAWYWYAGSFSGYLYDRYWTKDGTPYPFSPNPSGGAIPASEYDNNVLTTKAGESPGWIDTLNGDAGLVWRRSPSESTPPLFPTDPKPAGALSLMDYLTQRLGCQNIGDEAAYHLMPVWDETPSDVQFITDPTNGSLGYLRMYMPEGAYNNVVQLLVSSDLADTVVESIPLANMKIVSAPSDLGQLGAAPIGFSVQVQQTAADPQGSAGYIKMVPKSTDYASISPPSEDTGTMTPNQISTFSFTMTNLGEPKQTSSSFDIQVWNHNPVAEDQMTDSKTVLVTYMQISGITTTLVVNVVDGNTGNALSGIHVICNYGSTSLSGDTSGGAVSFNFDGTVPSVTVSAVDLTSKYSTATSSQQMVQGPNTMVLKMYSGPTPSPTPWLIIGIIAAVAVAAVAVVYVVKKKRK